MLNKNALELLDEEISEMIHRDRDAADPEDLAEGLRTEHKLEMLLREALGYWCDLDLPVIGESTRDGSTHTQIYNSSLIDAHNFFNRLSRII